MNNALAFELWSRSVLETEITLLKDSGLIIRITFKPLKEKEVYASVGGGGEGGMGMRILTVLKFTSVRLISSLVNRWYKSQLLYVILLFPIIGSISYSFS